MSFSTKTTCTLGCGSGVGAGGTVAHQNSIPYTWHELLEKEGTTFFYRDQDYYGIYYDQKSELTKDSKVLESTDKVDQGYKKIEEWCRKKLSSGYEEESEFEKEKKKILDYCTPQGIKTVKGKLGQIGQIKWIEDETNDKEDAYKVIFAIYRYNSKFLNWLNEGKDTGNKLTDTDKPSTKYSEIQKKCQATLKKNISEVSNPEEYGYATWWCQPLPYKKIEDKLKLEEGGWKERDDWESAAAIWNEVEEAKNLVKGTEANDPDKDKSWCQSTKSKELKEDDAFKKEYRAVYSICRP